MIDIDTNLLLIAATVLFIAGLIKGVIGFGVPTVSIVGLTMFISLKATLPLIATAVLLTNAWQAVNGGHFRELVGRFWKLFALSAATCVATYLVIGRHFPSLMLTVLGIVLVGYALSQIIQIIRTGDHRARPIAFKNPDGVGNIVGLLQGATTGLTGTFIVPVVMFLESLALDRDRMVQTMGLSFTVSAIALGVAVAFDGGFSASTSVMSVLITIPCFIGMFLGRLIRDRISERSFRLALLAGILFAGLHLLSRALRG